jgi:hypothetical protein
VLYRSLSGSIIRTGSTIAATKSLSFGIAARELPASFGAE